MKRKYVISAIAAVVVAPAVVWMWFGDPLLAYRAGQLRAAVRSISETEVTLNEVVPFDWDTVYTFAPYTSREEIEGVIGFRSNAVKETVSEGMVQLLFINGDAVIASVCAYADALGYRIDFPGCITYDEKAVFTVNHKEGIVQIALKQFAARQIA